MRRLVVHIGLEKTGSTYLQAFLRDNATLLAEHGIGYPDFCRGPEHLELYMASLPDVSWMHRRYRMGTPEAAAQLRADVSAGLRRMADTYATSVVSSERLSVMRAPEALEGLAVLCAEHFDRVEVVVFLRRPDHAVGSYYGQSVKSGMSSRSAEEFLAKQGRALDLQATLQRWRAVFGEDAVYPWPFLERYKGERDAGVEVLFHQLGLPAPGSDERWQRPGRPVNVRMSSVATEYMRQLNPRVPRWRTDGAWNGNQRIALMRELSARFPGQDAAAPPDIVAAVTKAFPAEAALALRNPADGSDGDALWSEWLHQPAATGEEPPKLKAHDVAALAEELFRPGGPVVADGAVPPPRPAPAGLHAGPRAARAVRQRLGRLKRRLRP